MSLVRFQPGAPQFPSKSNTFRPAAAAHSCTLGHFVGYLVRQVVSRGVRRVDCGGQEPAWVVRCCGLRPGEVTGRRPEKVSRRVKGLRAADDVERDLKNERESGSLTARRESLSAYAAGYLKSPPRGSQPADTHRIRRDCTRYVDTHAIGAMRIGDIDAPAVRSFYADVLERGSVGNPVSPETVRGVHRVLSMILRHAVGDGLLRVNPCERAKPPKDNRTDEGEREAGVDPEIAREFVAAVAATPIGAISAVPLGTGLRRSELLGLRWQDVDLDAGELHVSRQDRAGERLPSRARRRRRSGAGGRCPSARTSPRSPARSEARDQAGSRYGGRCRGKGGRRRGRAVRDDAGALER